MSGMRRIVGGALGVVLLFAGLSAEAQVRPNRGRTGPGAMADEGVSPAELQRLFDAYVVMQAQTDLQLTDEQFPRFLSRVRALQDARRRHQTERNRLLQQLRRLTQEAGGDEAGLRTQLKALTDFDRRAVDETDQAMSAVDEVLNVRQQARYRLLEEAMERRKVELLMRARQGNRPRAPQ